MAPSRKTMDKRKKLGRQVATADATRVRTGQNVLTGKRTTAPQTQRNLIKLGFCAAVKRRQEPDTAVEYCRQKAGWGTSHLGMGKCKNHGGNSPTHNASAARRQQIEFMGRPKDISPLDAIIWCIKITAGEVEWLSQQIAEINDKDDWYEYTVVGKQMNVLQRTRAEAQDRLVKYSKDAISLGLAERAVRMAEQFGQTIARLLEGIAGDLGLSASQRAAWPVVVRKHLILLEGGMPVSEADRKDPLAITRGTS